MFLYHVYSHNDSTTTKIYDALINGLNIENASIWGGNPKANLYPNIVNNIQSRTSDEWLELNNSFTLEASSIPFKNYLMFPFKDQKIYVFDYMIAEDYLDEYYEKEVAKRLGESTEGFKTENLPSKETLVKMYWDSAIALKDYVDHPIYAKPEYVCCQKINSKHLKGYIDGKLITNY
ncbi:hypothetical protein DH09_11510 [Bacillaceae bacterium JMAK1]|nr:hypothetical protein DH09_11510 [Bacillaceae bacterium JMAK1]